MIHFDTMLQKVHAWGEPEQHPMKRMFLTRIGSIACAVLELQPLGQALGKFAITLNKPALIDLTKRIVGVTSTLVIGIILSPEVNYFIHVKLGLAKDDIAERKNRRDQQILEKELQDKARAEQLNQQIASLA